MSAQDNPAAQAAQQPGTEGYGSSSYRAYILFALIVVYTFNFIDRTLIGILGESIRETFGLSDFMIGILSGLVFAFFYTLLGIPFALLAERKSRTWIIALALAAWSGMTALCGVAQNTAQFALARMGVGVGEAGCSPPAHSLISDYFPPDKRSSALSVFALGIPIGSMLASLGGAWIATRQGLDWRSAFIFMGLPGVAFAIFFKLTVKEPPRGFSDPGGAKAAALREKPSPMKVFKTVLGNASFWHVSLGGAMASFAGYGVGQFLTPFFLRVHNLELMQAALLYGGVLGIAAGFGTFSSGVIADRVRKRHPNSDAWLPALGFFISVPLYLIGYNTISFSSGSLALWLAIPPLLVAAYAHYFYLGPMFSVTQKLVEPRMRATAAALMLFLVNMIGYGFGPPVVGWFSDRGAQWKMAQLEAPLSLSACGKIESQLKIVRDNKPGAITDKGLSEALAANADYCAPARKTGIRMAVSLGALFYLWGALHFLLLGRTLQRDLWSPEKDAAK